jgi:hypothetical protein
MAGVPHGEVPMSFLGKAPTYTADRRLVGKHSGMYSEAEWTANRAEIEPFMSDRTAHGYRLSLYKDFLKTEYAVALTDRFDFTPFRRLGDIGGVPFLQARVILDRFPHLSAMLTDYDGESARVVESLGVFGSDVRFARLDLEQRDYAVLEGCDVMTMWAVDYAISDEALVDLFAHVARNGSTLLLAALHATIPNIISKHLKSRIYRLVGEARAGRRFHGWRRSDAYLEKLAARGGCRTSRRIRIGGYSVHVVSKA